MFRAVPDPSLDEILADVSRSFYLSLSILPRSMRTQLSGVYLVARAADTIADTHAVRPARRGELLADLRSALKDEARATRLSAELRNEVLGDHANAKPGSSRAASHTEAEERLLSRFGECLGLLGLQSADDRARTHYVLDHLVTGMEQDLARFPDETALRAMPSMEDLEQHLYRSAGCVGEYWTEMTAAHIARCEHLGHPELAARAVHLGKAIQLVNVIRDAPADLAAGRCYFPEPLLARHDLRVADLVSTDPEVRRAARAAVDELRLHAIEHVDAAWPYVLAIPRTAPRLRLACIWPLWLGLATLERIALAPDPLDPAVRIKVPRGVVYRIVAESMSVVAIDPMLSRRHWHHRAMAARRKLLGKNPVRPEPAG